MIDSRVLSMVESYVTYSFFALAASGIASVTLSFVFHLKLKNLERLPDDLEPKVFNKTFAIYDPYAPSRRIVHRFLTLLPFVTMFSAFGTTLFLLAAIENGLLLTLVLVIIVLAMMNVEEAEEAYQNSNILLRAFKAGDKMGTGDLKLLAVTKQVIPKIIRYFAGLAIIFCVTGAALFYFFNTLFQVFSEYVAFVFWVSEMVGAFGYAVACFMIALTFFALQLLASAVKRRILNLRLDV